MSKTCYQTKNASVQLAVWRKRGFYSSDTLCGTASFGSRQSFCDTPACRQAAASL